MSVTHRTTEFKTNIIGFYLPPESSIHGRDSANFFSRLTSLIYLCCNDDLTLICGDFNARISDKQDFIPDVDDIKDRKPIDQVGNKHGDNLIEFLKDTKTNILNGRFHDSKDNFTCISVRGRLVVDYFICPQCRA